MLLASDIVKKQSVREKLILATTREFGADQIKAMEYIVNHESGFSHKAINKTSGAAGIGQALPFSKTHCTLLYKDIDCQINWLIVYVRNKYGDFNNAQSFWENHNWY